MPRLLGLALTVVFILGSLVPVAAAARDTGPEIRASSALLMDLETGRVLWGRKDDVRRPQASITKIMTAVVALRYGNLDDEVTVSRRAASIGGSSMDIVAGETYTLGELLRGILLVSGNDAATAIAEHLAGSVSRFADLMNRTARDMGLRDSRFVNPHGLTAPGHYTTARDIGSLVRFAMKDPRFRYLIGLRKTEVQGKELRNTNRMLWTYPGTIGGKTGTTSAAGKCVVVIASRGAGTLIAVILDSRERWEEAKRLIEWGFENFNWVNVAKEGAVFRTVRVIGGKERRLSLVSRKGLLLPVRAGEREKLVLEVLVPRHLRAPVTGGTEVGTVNVLLDGEIVGTLPLETERDIEKKGLLPRILELFWPFG